jgi:hypothetical protein
MNGRGERIRTSDPLVPNQVLYQAEPLPELAIGRIYGPKVPGGSLVNARELPQSVSEPSVHPSDKRAYTAEKSALEPPAR